MREVKIAAASDEPVCRFGFLRASRQSPKLHDSQQYLDKDVYLYSTFEANV